MYSWSGLTERKPLKRSMSLVKTIESDDEVENEDIESEVEQNNSDSDSSQGNEEEEAEVTIPSTSDSKSSSFSQLNLSRPLLKSLKDLKFSLPTPIQLRAIPEALKGHDICGSAVTGSGKTAAYLLPTLERLLYRPSNNPAIRALVLCPTRELALQVSENCAKLSRFTSIRNEAVVGGVDLLSQIQRLKSHPDVICATPGRLVDHLRNTLGFSLEALEILILDESDRLLEMGFLEEVMEIIKTCPVKRQTMLFTATMTSSVSSLVDLSLKKPVRICVDPLFSSAKRLNQEFVRVKEPQDGTEELKSQLSRESVLLSLCSRIFTKKVIVFFRRKTRCHRVVHLFKLFNLNAAELNGNLTMDERKKNLSDFKNQKVDFLLCTDVAARGIDINNVQVVVNFDLPLDLKTYIHRVGRTARAGKKGTSVSLSNFDAEQKKLIKSLMKKTKQKVKLRNVDAQDWEKCETFVKESEQKMRDVMAEEKSERELKSSEKDLKKLENMQKFEHEIYAKPKRTWFQKNAPDSRKKEMNDNDREFLKQKRDYKKKRREKRTEFQEKEQISLTDRAKGRRSEMDADDLGFVGGGNRDAIENRKRSRNAGNVIFKDKESNMMETGGLRKGGKPTNKFKSKKKYKRR